MALGREAIYSAFFNQVSPLLLTPTGPFNFGNRRPTNDASLTQEQYPAFFLTENGEIYDRSILKAPARISLLCTLSVVSLQGEVDDETCVADLNNLADLVEDAIQSACISTAQNILGGLVQEAWIINRNLVTTGSYPSRTSKQNFMIELVLPHSR